MSRKRVLIVDDDPAIRELLGEYLTDQDVELVEAGSGLQTLDAVRRDALDLVLLDMRLPDINGLEVMRQIRDRGDDIPIIVVTADGRSSTTIEAMQLGAYDYLVKPLEPEQVQHCVRRLFEHRDLAGKVKTLQEQLEARDARERIVGRSKPMQRVYKLIGRVADTDATVLIEGETGTGKELVAETIHRNSHRREGPLIKVNCAALPETLLESELFGHEKGAFTGAVSTRKGRFELAHGGTIFLDEVGEMSPNTQKKLLRILQAGEFERVGGTVTLQTDARVVGATNKKLEQEVQQGRFREDLFYRLNVITIALPPLRERKDDIPLLVAHFLDKYRYRPDKPPTRISEEAMEILQQHDWPGNVRELENVVERAVVMSQGNVITMDHLTLDPVVERAGSINIVHRVRGGVPLDEVLAEVEAETIRVALEQTGYAEAQAAERLGISTQTLKRRLEKYNIRQGE